MPGRAAEPGSLSGAPCRGGVRAWSYAERVQVWSISRADFDWRSNYFSQIGPAGHLGRWVGVGEGNEGKSCYEPNKTNPSPVLDCGMAPSVAPIGRNAAHAARSVGRRRRALAAPRSSAAVLNCRKKRSGSNSCILGAGRANWTVTQVSRSCRHCRHSRPRAAGHGASPSPPPRTLLSFIIATRREQAAAEKIKGVRRQA